MVLSKQYGKYQVTITCHALWRMIQRSIYADNIIKIILNAAKQYQNSKKLIIVNEQENYSLVVVIEGNNIVLITVIKSNTYKPKENELLITV